MCVFQVVSALAVFRASWLFANEAGEVPKNPDAGIIRVAVLESAGTSPSALKLIDAMVVDTKHWARGKDNVQVKLSPDAVKLFETVDDEITLYYAQGPLLARNNVDDPGIPDLECLGTFATEVAKKGAPRGVMIGCSAIIRCEHGQGRVFCFSPHPELTPGQGHLLIKAVHWLCNH